MSHPIDILRKIHRLTPEQINLLDKAMVEKHFPKGSILNLTAYPDSTNFYIKKGAARTFYILKGKEYTTSFAFDDEYLVFPERDGTDDSFDMMISIMDESDILYLPMPDIRNIMAGGQRERLFQEGLLFMNASLIEYNRLLQERIKVLHSMSAAERYEWAIKKYPRLLEYATVTQLASYLGVTKETLYRIRSGKYRLKK